MQQINIHDQTFQRLLEQARAYGFRSVPEYLDDLAEHPEDDFVMTPEIKAALDEGLEDLRNGRMVSAAQVREDISRLGREWRAGHS